MAYMGTTEELMKQFGIGQKNKKLDYTLIGKDIEKTMRDIGEPLTEKQYMILQGALAAYQSHISETGLASLLNSLANQK